MVQAKQGGAQLPRNLSARFYGLGDDDAAGAHAGVVTPTLSLPLQLQSLVLLGCHCQLPGALQPTCIALQTIPLT